MATTAGDIYVRSGDSGAFTAVEYVQGGWTTVDSGSTMRALDESRLKDGQVIYVRSEGQTYITSRFVAYETPGYSGFVNSASFASFDFSSGGGGGSGDITAVTAGSGLSGGASTGAATLAIDTGSTHFINGVSGVGVAGIFNATGSNYATTNNLEITGSLFVEISDNTDFIIYSSSKELVKVNNEGVIILTTHSIAPTLTVGGLYVDDSGSLFVGSVE